jgi:hypothetical protein
MWRSKLPLILFLPVALLLSAPAWSAELLMFEAAGCPYCARWTEAIGPVYPKTAEGRRAPLRRVDIHATRPADLTGIKGIVYTPTFVLWHNGREYGRITGYPGEAFFWGMLAEMIRKLPPATDAAAPARAAPPPKRSAE